MLQGGQLNKLNFNIVFCLLISLVVTLTGAIFFRPFSTLIKDQPESHMSKEQKAVATGHSVNLSELRVIKEATIKVPSPWKVGAEVPAELILIQAPESQSADRLMGTLSGKGCKNAIAVVMVDNQQQSYRCGDYIEQNKIKIVKIFRDVVVINNSGYYETLHIKE